MTQSHWRSWLFTPATRPDRFDRAGAASADVLIIDLEDAVAPADKETARQAALDWLTLPAPSLLVRALRINAPATPHGLEDLLGLLKTGARPDAVLLPKVNSGETLRLVDRLFTDAGQPARLVALIESARGVAAAEEIAGASPRLAALFFGAADLAADLGGEPTWEALLFARSRLVNAAALAGVDAVEFALVRSFRRPGAGEGGAGGGAARLRGESRHTPPAGCCGQCGPDANSRQGGRSAPYSR